MLFRSADHFSSHYHFLFSSSVSFSAQRGSRHASTPLLLLRHMGLCTSPHRSAPSRHISFTPARKQKQVAQTMFHKYPKKTATLCARARVCVCKLTLSQILCEDKWALALRRAGKKKKKWLHVVLKHTQSYASTESQRSCQRGGSLFIYCLYTEKKETASIM